MQTYLFIVGGHDGLNYPASAADPEQLQLAVGIMGRETYSRATLNLADVSVAVYSRPEGQERGQGWAARL